MTAQDKKDLQLIITAAIFEARRDLAHDVLNRIEIGTLQKIIAKTRRKAKKDGSVNYQFFADLWLERVDTNGK